MFYTLLSIHNNNLLYNLTLNLTYSHDDSYASGYTIDIVNINTGEIIEASTNVYGNTGPVEVVAGLYSIKIEDEVIDTIYINKDTLRSYTIEKESNIKHGLLYSNLYDTT